MSPGAQLAQSVHAAFEFAFSYPELTKNWMDISNYITILSISNESELMLLIEKALDRDIELSLFLESDMNNELTALALAPCKESKKLCQKLKLALK